MSETSKSYMDGLAKSAKDATKGWNIIKRVVLALFFAVVLSLKSCTTEADKAGTAGKGLIGLLIALKTATFNGVQSALQSIYPIITNLQSYWDGHYWGSIALTAVFIIALVGLLFQGISFLLNIVDGKVGQVFGFIIRLVVTLLVIFMLSWWVNYHGAVDTIFTTSLNENMTEPNPENNTIIDVILPNIPTINLLDDGGGTNAT